MQNNYQIALDKAIAWINDNYKPTSIIVSGSIVRGNPNANSDFDIFVIHADNYRQRLQKYFDGVPCEIFINNITHVYDYFETEYKNNRPVTAHMIATGNVLTGDNDTELIKLVKTAKDYLVKSPGLTAIKSTAAKYSISTLFEDATDLADTDPITSTYFLNKVVADIIELVFLENSLPLPRAKERISAIIASYPEIGNSIAEYYKAESFKVKYHIAETLVLNTVGWPGFFEWDSGRD